MQGSQAATLTIVFAESDDGQHQEFAGKTSGVFGRFAEGATPPREQTTSHSSNYKHLRSKDRGTGSRSITDTQKASKGQL